MTPDTPAALGYRMPAEWEPHEATWIAWPHNRDDWPGKFAPIPWVYVEIVRHLSRVERVDILVDDRDGPRPGGPTGSNAPGSASSASGSSRRPPTASGPATRGRPSWSTTAPRATESALIDWRFNAWAKYDNHRNDDRIPRLLARRRGLKRWAPAGRGRRPARPRRAGRGRHRRQRPGDAC